MNMKTLGWVLTIIGGIASVVTYIMQMGPLNWVSIAVVIVGVILMQAGTKIHLEAGETLYYKGTAKAGEGGLLKSSSKADVKVAVTNKGLRCGDIFGKGQSLIEFPSVKGFELVGPLSVRIWLHTNESLQLQFGISARDKFVQALQSNNVQTFNPTAGAAGQSGYINQPAAPAGGLCLLVKNYRLPLMGGQKLYACHVLAASSDSQTVAGEVTTSKKNPSLLGIRNLSNDEWLFTDPVNNERKSVRKGEVFPLSIEAKHEILVNFRDVGGRIAVI